MEWPGIGTSTNDKNYYYRKVVSYYGEKVRENPYNPLDWYNLAESLIYSGEYNDARIAVDVGTSLNPNTNLKERFNNLKVRIPPS